MNSLILVAYASRYGSTREIAEHLAATLRSANLTVDCRAMDEVDDIAGYRGRAVLLRPLAARGPALPGAVRTDAHPS